MAEEPNMQSIENNKNNESSKNKIEDKNKEDDSNVPQLNNAAQKQPTDDINHCCRDCIRWDKYGEKCFYWWKGKRYCSRRVTSMEELDAESLFLG